MQKRIVEFKAATSDRGRFSGRASVYGVVDLQGDVVMPGAFTRSLQESGSVVKILNQHNPSDVLGLGTLSDTADALLIDGQLELDLLSGREAYIRLQKGLLDGLSIGYETLSEGYARGVRQLKTLRLHEVSLVTFPANPLSRIQSVKRRGDEQELKALLSTIQSISIAIRNDQDLRDAKQLEELLRGLRA